VGGSWNKFRTRPDDAAVGATAPPAALRFDWPPRRHAMKMAAVIIGTGAGANVRAPAFGVRQHESALFPRPTAPARAGALHTLREHAGPQSFRRGRGSFAAGRESFPRGRRSFIGRLTTVPGRLWSIPGHPRTAASRPGIVPGRPAIVPVRPKRAGFGSAKAKPRAGSVPERHAGSNLKLFHPPSSLHHEPNVWCPPFRVFGCRGHAEAWTPNRLPRFRVPMRSHETVEATYENCHFRFRPPLRRSEPVLGRPLLPPGTGRSRLRGRSHLRQLSTDPPPTP